MNEDDAPPPPRGLRAAYPGAPVTLAITAMNIVVFLLELAVDQRASALLVPRTTTLLALGANYGPSTLHEGRVEALLASCFLHIGLMHIGFNMVALKQIGPFVERLVGPGRFALMYVVTGIIGSLTSASWTPLLRWVGSAAFPPGSDYGAALMARTSLVSAGASGAICGVIGAALVIGVRSEGWRSPITRATGRWLGTIVLFGLFLGFDNAAHLGGAASGALIASLWKRKPETPQGRMFRLAVVGGLLAVTSARVAYVAATNPYARFTAEERVALARAHARRGECVEAQEALEAALRIVPHVLEGDLTDPLAACTRSP